MQERKSADVAAFVFHSLNTAKLQLCCTMGFSVGHSRTYLLLDALIVVKAKLIHQLLFRFLAIANALPPSHSVSPALARNSPTAPIRRFQLSASSRSCFRPLG